MGRNEPNYRRIDGQRDNKVRFFSCVSNVQRLNNGEGTIETEAALIASNWLVS